MDLVYSVNRKHGSPVKSQQNYEYLHEGHTLCSISSRNVVAFTTTTELGDVSGKTWGSHVYIADLNVPWHSHKLLSNSVEVTALEWDLPGGKLLVADSDGQIQIWSPREHLMNDWICLATANFPGEHILAAAFFHSGRKIGLVAEKKDSILYSEKFSHLRFAPSVRHFGGRPLEGCVLVSSTGMVGVVALSREGSTGVTRTVEHGTHHYQALTASESLGSTRNRITAVDICYGKNGHFLVAVSGGNTSMPVQCYRVSVKKVEDKMSLTSQALPSFFLQCNTLKENNWRQVAQLRFVVREDADSLVVTANGENNGLVEIWELREKPVVVHKLLQRSTPSTPPPEPFKTIVWQHKAHWQTTAPIKSVVTTKASLSTAVPPPSYVMVALSDCSLHCLFRDSLKQVATTTLTVPWRDESSLKMSRGSLTVSAMDLTWAGSALLVADTRGQLYLYRVLPVADPGGGPLTVPYAVTLLEYCLMSGMDWWDVLLALRPSMLEAVCERFSESFLRQPSAMQQFHYSQYLCIKTSLYRLALNGQPKAADLSNLLMLHSVATAFKSLLRPSDLANHDKGPAESLAIVMSEPIADIHRALLNLEPKEFTVEPSTLQSLQQLIQWVADLALNLLARLPEHRQARAPGYELLRDAKALNELRELLVIIRIWGLVRQTCLPVFVQSADNLDVLALCFKLLSRMVQSHGAEPDDALIDECVLLPSQVLIPQLNPSTPIVAVMLPTLFYHCPIQLEYGVEPESLQLVPETNNVEGALQAQQVLDSVRHIFLGKRPLLVRICCRCGGMAQAHSTPRTAAIRAWDQRWAKTCRCGGRWRLHRFSS